MGDGRCWWARSPGYAPVWILSSILSSFLAAKGLLPTNSSYAMQPRAQESTCNSSRGARELRIGGRRAVSLGAASTSQKGTRVLGTERKVTNGARGAS